MADASPGLRCCWTHAPARARTALGGPVRKLISGPRARHMRGLFCSCTVVIGSPVRPFVASWPLACLDTGHWPPAISGVRRPQAVRKRPEALASRYHAWYSRRWRTLASANGAQVEPLACPVSATSTLKGRYDYGPPHNPGNEGLSVFVFFLFRHFSALPFLFVHPRVPFLVRFPASHVLSATSATVAAAGVGRVAAHPLCPLSCM